MKSVKDYYSYSPTARQRFGAPRGNRKHRGLDISYSTTPGTPVPALLGGRVISTLGPASWHGFGYQVTIRSEFGGKTYDISYSHGKSATPLKVGETVRAGQKVLEEGRTGSTNGSCVHIEVFDRSLGVYINPSTLIESVLTVPAPAGDIKPTQRLVTSDLLYRRARPDTKGKPLDKPLKKGTVGNFTGWRRGQKVKGNDIWFRGISGDWFWSGGFEGGPRTTGLADLNPKSSTATRTVRTLPGSKAINGRSQPKTSGKVTQRLARGKTGTFNGWRKGKKITQNGVTSNVWFRGAFNGNWFWAGNFTSQSTAGLPQV